jgi:hypothetical protein
MEKAHPIQSSDPAGHINLFNNRLPFSTDPNLKIGFVFTSIEKQTELVFPPFGAEA